MSNSEEIYVKLSLGAKKSNLIKKCPVLSPILTIHVLYLLATGRARSVLGLGGLRPFHMAGQHEGARLTQNQI